MGKISIKEIPVFLLICTIFYAIACSDSKINGDNSHVYYGYPEGTPSSNKLVSHNLYSLSSNRKTKIADWVAYRLDKSLIEGQDKSRNWKTDPFLEDSLTLEPGDYEDAYSTIGTDRGHFAPLGSLDGNDSWYETNYTSNISPQKSALNRGPWKDLEEFERKLIEEEVVPYIHVVTGPLYENEMPSLPNANESHKIPSGYWKIIVVPLRKENHDFFTFGFIFNQDDGYEITFIKNLVTIDEIEVRSSLDFFALINKPMQDKFESHYHKSLLNSIEN